MSWLLEFVKSQRNIDRVTKWSVALMFTFGLVLAILITVDMLLR